jgi:hypothetical protein
MVALMATRLHLVVDAAIGAYKGKGTSEPALAKALWNDVPDNALLLADRNFIDYEQLYRFSSIGVDRHWIVRTKESTKTKHINFLPDGTELAEVEIHRSRRRRDPSLPRWMRVRIIHDPLDGERRRLMTSLRDPDRWPADEVLAMYHSPQTARQEVWGIVLAYNLVRQRMAIAAQKLQLQPRGMRLIYSLRLVRAFLSATARDTSLANTPRFLAKLDQELESATLPARRAKRRHER